MKPFNKYEGTIVPIMYDNIDTDQLIPKQFLKSILTRKKQSNHFLWLHLYTMRR